MKGGRALPSMLRKEGIISCCYEHCFLSVRQGEVAENLLATII
jgi:hypothetical protein